MREKNFRPEFRSCSTRARKFLKIIKEKIKKLKNSFTALFLAKMGCDRRRKREKKFRPEFFHTRPGQENSEKNRKKKIEKLKKTISGIIFSQKGMG